MTSVLGFVLLVGLALSASFFFSGMEAGVLSLSPLRLRQQMRAGDRPARVLVGFLEQPEDFLWTILIGNTLANFLLVSLSFFLLHLELGQWPGWLFLALALVLFIWYALGDLLPKMLFRQHATRLCLLLAPAFRIVHLLLSPAVSLAAWLATTLLRRTGGRRFTGNLFGNRDELRQAMQDPAQPLTAEERQMVVRVLDLQNVTVGAITVPLPQVTVVAVDTPVSEVVQLCRDRDLGRLPVVDRPGGRIVGIFSLRVALYQTTPDDHRPVGAFLLPGLFLPESLRLDQALRRLRDTGQRLAVVLDREGREAGIVTFADVLHRLFGDVPPLA